MNWTVLFFIRLLYNFRFEFILQEKDIVCGRSNKKQKGGFEIKWWWTWSKNVIYIYIWKKLGCLGNVFVYKMIFMLVWVVETFWNQGNQIRYIVLLSKKLYQFTLRYVFYVFFILFIEMCLKKARIIYSSGWLSFHMISWKMIRRIFLWGSVTNCSASSLQM